MQDDVSVIVSRASKFCGGAEVFATRAKSISVFADNGKASMAIASEESGFGLRVLKNNRVGFAFSSDFSKTAIEQTIKRALVSAKLNRENKGFEFPSKKSTQAGKVAFDKKILQVVDEGGESAVSFAREFCKSVEAEGCALPLASFKWSIVECGVENSSGVSKNCVASFFAAEPYVIAKKNGAKAESINFKVRRDFPEGWLEGKFAGESAGLARESLDARQVKSGKYDCIFHPSETAALFEETFGYMFSGSARFDGVALFKQGERVMDERVSVRDSMDAYGANASFGFDQEGVSRKAFAAVHGGVFAGELFDSFYAGLLGEKATGNARRESHDLENWYQSPPHCGFNNADFSPGDRSLDELVGETKRGIYVVRTAYPLADSVSGSFTNEIRSGFFIENGEIKHPVKSTVVNGSFYDLMKNRVLAFSKEREVSATSSDALCSGAIVPHFKFKDVLFSGSAPSSGEIEQAGPQ